MNKNKRRDGFEGEKQICLPRSVWKNIIEPDPVLSRLYVAQIGYFPKASFHYRERRKGCTDNILIYCVMGKGWYKIKDRRFEIGPNEFVILPATSKYVSYGADAKDPWTIYWLHFSGHDLQIFNRRFGIGLNDAPRRILFNEKGLQLWATMYQNLEKGYNNENLSNANLCLYHFIATFLFPDKSGTDNQLTPEGMINKVVGYMRSRLGDILTIREMADQCQLSASHFSSLFRKATGMSPLLYFIRLKLEKACLILYNSNTKVKDIAASLGYEDPYYFSRLFKKYMRISPERYRSLRQMNPVIKPPSAFQDVIGSKTASLPMTRRPEVMVI